MLERLVHLVLLGVFRRFGSSDGCLGMRVGGLRAGRPLPGRRPTSGKMKKGEGANDRTTSRNTTLIPPADLRGRVRHSLFLVTNALPQLWVLYLTPLSMDDSRLQIDQTADYGLKWHGIVAGIR